MIYPAGIFSPEFNVALHIENYTMKAPLFHSLLSQEIQTYGQTRHFPAETVIQEERGYIKFVPIVVNGSIRVLRTEEDGREILLYYITPGESCIMSFLGGIHQETSKIRAIVEEEAEILLIPVEKASAWISQFPEWADFIFKLYHKRFEELLSVVDAIAFKKLDSRLLNLLKQKAELFQTHEIKVTHQQLADELGSTREVVSRVIKQMEKEGLVKLSRNKIHLM